MHIAPTSSAREGAGVITPRETSSFESWTAGRDLAVIGTNAGSAAIPFQTWKKFKEAFAPELVREAVENSPIPVRRLLDPFGGSGTSALAAQFLGVHPVTVEVNPYLADLIEAKLTNYDPSELTSQLSKLLSYSTSPPESRTHSVESSLPPTFVEPGVKGRYLFNSEVAREIEALNDAARSTASEEIERFFRVALSGVILDFCNARVNGKGRRYRGNWQKAQHTAAGLRSAFTAHAQQMINDVERLGQRSHMGYDLIRGDSRTYQQTGSGVDLVVFSPPYPNSFDYTDVYNIELWMLGYLRDKADNGELRGSTLSSHVQISRDFGTPPHGSDLLDRTIREMRAKRAQLWDKRLPEMVAGYFADLLAVIDKSAKSLTDGGQLWMVVGDSRYSTVDIRVAEIVSELAPSHGLSVTEIRPFRSMRASPQQGGRAELLETLVVLRK